MEKLKLLKLCWLFKEIFAIFCQRLMTKLKILKLEVQIDNQNFSDGDR